MSRKNKMNKPQLITSINSNNPPGKQKGGKYELTPIKPQNICHDLRKLSTWCLWRFHWDRGKFKKPPIRLNSQGKEVWIDDGMTKFKDGSGFYSFEEALAETKKRPKYSLGLVLPRGQREYVCLDFDSYRNNLTGKIDPDGIDWLKKIGVRGWSELSVSGTGYHTFIKASLDKYREFKPDSESFTYSTKGKDGSDRQIEVYEAARFLAFSGNPLHGYSPKFITGNAQDVLDELIGLAIEQAREGSKVAPKVVSVAPRVIADLSELEPQDQKIVDKLLTDQKFSANWYCQFEIGQRSNPAMSLINSIAPRTKWDFDQTYTIFAQSRVFQDYPERFDEDWVHQAFKNAEKTCKHNYLKHSRISKESLPTEGGGYIDRELSEEEREFIRALTNLILPPDKILTEDEQFQRICELVRKLKYDDHDFPFSAVQQVLSDRSEDFLDTLLCVWQDCEWGESREQTLRAIHRRFPRRFKLSVDKPATQEFASWLYHFQQKQINTPIPVSTLEFAPYFNTTPTTISNRISRLKYEKLLEDANDGSYKAGEYPKSYWFTGKPIDESLVYDIYDTEHQTEPSGEENEL